MAYGIPAKTLTPSQLWGFFRTILGPEKNFYWLAAIYGIGISLLSLATPISVQMLINSVASTGLTTPLVILSLTLFALLAFSGLLNAMRIHLMDVFQRKFYARMVSIIAVRSVYAQNPFFADKGQEALFNRYFDIIIVQKSIPGLFIGGFTLLLQAGVGFVVVSMYHAWFFAFVSVVLLCMWAIWLIWGRTAINTSLAKSHKKHEVAAWLEDVGASNGYYKSDGTIRHAMGLADKHIAKYIQSHEKHFKQHYAQTLSFLFLYAASSAILLGLGGWLVTQGQLTLGQLVAAELILSGVFFGVSQLGSYLTYFYDLCAAVEELSYFLDVEQEAPAALSKPARKDSSISFVKAGGHTRGQDTVLDFSIPSGANVMATAENFGIQRMISSMLRRHVDAKNGYVAFGGGDITSTDAHSVRAEIMLIDRPTIVESTIEEHLRLAADDVTPDQMLFALKAVGLEPVITALDKGQHTELASTGWPLSISEVMQLKLARAIIARPRVLIMNQLFDLVSESCMRSAIAALEREQNVTVLYFSNRRHDLGFELFLHVEPQRQWVYDSFTDFAEAAFGRQRAEQARNDKAAGTASVAMMDEG